MKMFVYKITNNINNKKYIGITIDYKRRWKQHINNSSSLVHKAIEKYGVENFSFELLYYGLSIEEASNIEIDLISKENCLVPNGYNIAKGGYNISGNHKSGEENGNSKLTLEEAQYIKDHRDIPMYVLYDEFCDKISYITFKKVYNNKTYPDAIPHVDCYPYNLEFSNQFTSSNKLSYNDIVELRKQYNDGVYWKEAYEKYKDLYPNEKCFWEIYRGNRYKLVMPEVFTVENQNKQKALSRIKGKKPNSKMTEQDVILIRKLHNNGKTNKEIYKMFPQVTTGTILKIIKGETWKYLL